MKVTVIIRHLMDLETISRTRSIQAQALVETLTLTLRNRGLISVIPKRKVSGVNPWKKLLSGSL